MTNQPSLSRTALAWVRRMSVAFCVPAMLLFCLTTAFAQTDTARLQGTVADQNGGVLSGATVTVTNLGTNREVSVQSNESGDYIVPALAPGRYKVEVKLTDFKTINQEITLEISQVAGVNFTLEPGGVSDVVIVSSDAPLVETGNSAVGEVIQGRQVTELPLNGRNFTQLATLVPGVNRGIPDGAASGAGNQAETFRNGNTGGAALSVNGLREQANNFTLDGTDNNESLVNTIIFFPPAEAVQEFRVQTSVAPAEFGRAGGAIVGATIKSGTNELHGSVFEFLRNDNLDARPTFAQQKAEFKRNQFGFTIGGPVIKDKLFVFGDYQGLRQSLPLNVDFASVPTAAMRNGDFSQLLNPASSGLPSAIIIRDPLTGNPFPGNVIPSTRINRVGQNYLNAFPAPNNGSQVQGNYIAQRVQSQNDDNFDVRMDWFLSEKDQLFGRFSFGETDSITTSRLPALPAGFGSGTQFNNARGFTLGETHTFSPNLINEFRFGFIRVFYGYQPPFSDQTVSADLGIPNANTSPLLGGGALIGGFNGQIEYTGDFGPFLVPQNTFQFTDTMTYIRGNHNVRFGFNIIRRQVNLFRPNRGKGFFFIGPGTGNTTGYEVSELLAGFIDNYTIGTPFGTVGTRNWETGYFIQDDWRVNRKLTVNAGLRYDLYTFPVEVADRQANFDLATGRLLVAGDNGNSRSLIPTDKNNFAPRLGFAYDFAGDGKTVLRGGYGLFYFLDRGGIDNQLAQNPPFSGFAQFNFNDGVRITLGGRGPNGNGRTGSLDSRNATGPLPLGNFTNLDLNNPSGVTVFAQLDTNVNSYVQQWSMQVQRQLNSETALSIGYVGTQGKKLVSYYNLNRNFFNAPGGARPFPRLGDVNVAESRGNSIYHSLQVQLERRLTKGWQYLMSYTWGHAIDDSRSGFSASNQPQDVRNFRLERGSADVDSRHRFVFSSLYELPFGRGRQFGANMNRVADLFVGGWQVNGILTLQSGFPFDLNTNGNPGQVRPDLVGSPSVNSDTVDRYLVRGQFREVEKNGDGVFLRPGGAGRNFLVGPGTKNFDLSLFKSFAITERIRTEFRTEFYNLTNTPQFSQPNTNVSDGNFGRILGTRLGTNRQIQFALRVVF